MDVFGPNTFHFISLVKFQIFDFDVIQKIRNTEKNVFQVLRKPKIRKILPFAGPYLRHYI